MIYLNVLINLIGKTCIFVEQVASILLNIFIYVLIELLVKRVKVKDNMLIRNKRRSLVVYRFVIVGVSVNIILNIYFNSMIIRVLFEFSH